MGSTNLEPQLDLRTVAEICDEFVWLKPATLRGIIFHRRENGFALLGVYVKIGAKVLIDRPRFIEWVERHREVL